MAEKELAGDEKYLSDLSTDCQQKATDWEVRLPQLDAAAEYLCFVSKRDVPSLV